MVNKSKLAVATFFWLLKLSTLRNLDCLRRLISHAFGYVLDLLDDIITLNDFSKDNVLAVEPGGDGGGDEELELPLV